MPPFFFQDFESSLLSLLWIIFQVDCLSPLHLVVFVCLYLPSFATYFYAILFYLNFCVCDFLSAGCRFVFPLAYDVSSWWVRFVQRFLQPFWWEWLVFALCEWSWVLSLWWVGPYQGVHLGVSVSLYDFRQPFCWWVGLVLLVVVPVITQHCSLQAVCMETGHGAKMGISRRVHVN